MKLEGKKLGIWARNLRIGKKPARVVAMFKKGDRHQPANYRPVSLTSITCKVLEHIIHSNIMQHFDYHQILDQY